MGKVVFKNEYFQITEKEEQYYIESYRRGMSMEVFNQLMAKLSFIKITSFMAVKNAIIPI